MGCKSSKELQPREASVSKGNGNASGKQHNLAPPPDLDPLNRVGVSSLLPVGGPLTAKEYRERIRTSGGSREWVVPGAGCKVRWAFCSQRGYYPNSLDKPSQDAHCAHVGFGGDPDCGFFGVFDGHGEHGTPCAEFARDQLPVLLQADPEFKTAPHIAYYNAFMQTNEKLHASNVDDVMSGTRGITVLMRGRHIYVANVGDSRAVVSERAPDGSLIARDLSSDQTPYRQDELRRVRACGAVVLTLDQLEGIKDPTMDCWTSEYDDDGDPPRLWLPDNMFPGTAFTRSIGDAIAERIGVFAEPEVLIKKLTSRNRHIILASDGVFEFMPSQKVVDMVSKFTDLEEACVAVCSESYRLWLSNETRTDDITIILMELVGLEDDGLPEEDVLITSPPHGVAPPGGAVPGALGTVTFAPVEGNSDEELAADLAQIAHDITPEEEELLNAVAMSNIVLADLTPEERAAVYSVVRRYKVKAGDAVISEGEPGTGFFIVQHGKLSVLMAPEPGAMPELVHTYQVEEGEEPPSFGEMGLLYSKPRAATVVAQTDGELLFLDRRDLKAALASMDMGDVLGALRKVEVLAPLMSCELQFVLDLMVRKPFADGQALCEQGEEGNTFFVLVEGSVECWSKASESAEAKMVLRVTRHQCLGERALQGPGRRAATVLAKGAVTALEISRATFEEAVGPLRVAADEHRAWQERAGRAAVPPSDLSGLAVGSLTRTATLWGTELSGVGVVDAPSAGRTFLVRNTAAAPGAAAPVCKGQTVLTAAPSVPVLPPVSRVVKDTRGVMEIIDTRPLCTVGQLLQHSGPVPESVAKYIAACVAVGLESLHRSGIVYRAVCADTLVITEQGLVQLVEPRHSKAIMGRTYTLCGQPTYMAPEMVEMRGHTQAVDWWALGVLVFEMLTGTTPFEAGAEDELHLYYAILDSEVAFPATVSATAQSAIGDFMRRDPAQRLGHGTAGLLRLKSHPFFSGVDFVAALGGQHVVPPELLQRLEGIAGTTATNFQI